MMLAVCVFRDASSEGKLLTQGSLDGILDIFPAMAMPKDM
jgi:hypothetical protein